VTSNEDRRHIVEAVTAGVEAAMRVCAVAADWGDDADGTTRGYIDYVAEFVANTAKEHAMKLAESYKTFIL